MTLIREISFSDLFETFIYFILCARLYQLTLALTDSQDIQEGMIVCPSYATSTNCTDGHFSLDYTASEVLPGQHCCSVYIEHTTFNWFV